MKIICDKKELLKKINIVEKAKGEKSIAPIVECILIDANSSNIKIAGNNFDLYIESVLEGNIIEKGMVAINCNLFKNIISKMPEEEIIIYTNEIDNNITTQIECNNKSLKIDSKDGNEFSIIPSVEEITSFNISEYELKEMINQTIICVASKDQFNNAIYRGEQFLLRGNEFRINAVDGFKVAIRSTTINSEIIGDKNVNIVVPGQTLKELSSILSDSDENVNITVSNNNILFKFNNNVVVSKLIEGNYLDIEKSISFNTTTNIVIDNKELFNSINLSMVFCNNVNSPIIMDIEDNYLNVKINQDNNSMYEKIFIEKEGEGLRIGFNPRNLYDILKVIKDDKINLGFTNEVQPCIIKDTNNTYTYIILPLKIA